jgi:ParB-like chromosome segregation protein Spo0J
MAAKTAENLAIEWWPLEKITPYERNARVISEKAVEKVASSLTEFGWQQPIVVDEGGVIIAGHTRLLAAASLEHETVPVLVAVDLAPEQVKAYRLADNRTHQETDWDFALLAPEMKTLEEMGFDLALTAFDFGETNKLDEFLDRTSSGSHTKEINPDDFELMNKCPKCGFEYNEK